MYEFLIRLSTCCFHKNSKILEYDKVPIPVAPNTAHHAHHVKL